MPWSLKPLAGKESEWEALKLLVTKGYYQGFRADVEFSNDSVFRDLTPESFVGKRYGGYTIPFIFLVDSITIAQHEHPILCVDLMDEPGRAFRVVPSAMWAVENNLSIANADFVEFYTDTDEDGIYRWR